jgi:hypothetical protein
MSFHEKAKSAGGPVDARLAAEIKARIMKAGLPCSAAMDAAEARGADPLDVGRAADALGIRVTACQLGLFGFPGRSKGRRQIENSAAGLVSPGFEEAVREAGTADGNITCLDLWVLAVRFSMPRIEAGRAADRLGLKVRNCQLGAF